MLPAVVDNLHIGHINTGRDWGGGEHQVLHLLQGLRKHGIRSTLFAHPRGKLIVRAGEAGISVQPLPEIGLMALPWPLLLPFARRVCSLGCNLIHIHDSRGLWVGSWIRRWTGIPAVLSRRIASPLRRNRISVRKYSESNLHSVIAVSETVREVFAGFGFPEERIHVVTDGLDIDDLMKIEPDDSFRDEGDAIPLVGGIGKLSVKKNWQLLVRTAARLAGQGHDLRWVVFGEGPERSRLEELSRRLGVEGIVRFPGFHEDAIRTLKSFDVLFHPSLMEGASVTIRSAMVIGVPVVTADAPASVESLDGHGWVVGGDDVPAAAAAIQEAVSDEVLRRQRCDAARKSAISRFSIEKTVQGTIRVYREALT